MKKRGKTNWLLAVACLFVLWTVVPQVNAKNAGVATDGGMSIYEGEPTEADCRMCHDNLDAFPMLLASNPDRHHALSSDIASDCLYCHSLIWSDILEADVVSYSGNCLGCHEVSAIEGGPATTNVHHETETFAARDCGACHK
ncbi:MAG: hypothetical protein KJ804_20480 [Proteobacteria bacterium]|nr:hypothetical protein [Pseudomonadota bacterium]MBU1060686.1 hypothetical protein [Pseudomonadota bacterium]